MLTKINNSYSNTNYMGTYKRVQGCIRSNEHDFNGNKFIKIAFLNYPQQIQALDVRILD